VNLQVLDWRAYQDKHMGKTLEKGLIPRVPAKSQRMTGRDHLLIYQQSVVSGRQFRTMLA
jgi:hypothetical protein